MKRATYLEFEKGDPEPQVPFVIDYSGDTWNREDGGWIYGMDVRRDWKSLVSEYGPVRVPADQAAEHLVPALTQAVADAEKRLAEARQALAHATGAEPVATRVIKRGDPEPKVPGITLRDRDGDHWRLSPDGTYWMFSHLGQSSFNEGDRNSWEHISAYAPLEVVTQPTS